MSISPEMGCWLRQHDCGRGNHCNQQKPLRQPTFHQSGWRNSCTLLVGACELSRWIMGDKWLEEELHSVAGLLCSRVTVLLLVDPPPEWLEKDLGELRSVAGLRCYCLSTSRPKHMFKQQNICCDTFVERQILVFSRPATTRWLLKEQLMLTPIVTEMTGSLKLDTIPNSRDQEEHSVGKLGSSRQQHFQLLKQDINHYLQHAEKHCFYDPF